MGAGPPIWWLQGCLNYGCRAAYMLVAGLPIWWLQGCLYDGCRAPFTMMCYSFLFNGCWGAFLMSAGVHFPWVQDCISNGYRAFFIMGAPCTLSSCSDFLCLSASIELHAMTQCRLCDSLWLYLCLLQIIAASNLCAGQEIFNTYGELKPSTLNI